MATAVVIYIAVAVWFTYLARREDDLLYAESEKWREKERQAGTSTG